MALLFEYFVTTASCTSLIFGGILERVKNYSILVSASPELFYNIRSQLQKCFYRYLIKDMFLHNEDNLVRIIVSRGSV